MLDSNISHGNKAIEKGRVGENLEKGWGKPI